MKVKYDLTAEEGRKDAMKKIATAGAVDGTVIGQPIISAAVCILGWIFNPTFHVRLDGGLFSRRNAA